MRGSRQSLSAGLLAGSSAYDERGRRTSECARPRQERDRDGHAAVAGAARVAVDRAERVAHLEPLSQRETRRAAARPWHGARVAVAIDRRVGAGALGVDGAAAQVQTFTSRGASVVYHPDTRLPASDVSHHGTQTLAGGHLHARWSPHAGVTLAGGVRADRVLDLETFVGGWAQAQVALSTRRRADRRGQSDGQSPDVLQRFGPAGTADLAFETATLVDAGLAWRRGPWGLALNVYDRREADGLDTPERQFRLTPDGAPRRWQPASAVGERVDGSRARRRSPPAPAVRRRARGVSGGRDGSATATAPRHTRARSIRSFPAHSISVIS